MEIKKYFRRNCFVLLCLLLSITIAAIFISKIVNAGYTFWNEGKVAFDVTGQVGDFIGGVVGTILSFVSVLFVYRTFTEQIEGAQKQNFEDHFYQMLEIHNNSLDRTQFEAVLTRFLSCHDQIKPFIDARATEKCLFLDQSAADVTEADIDIVYCTVFFGMGAIGSKLLESILKKKYTGEFVDSYIVFLKNTCSEGAGPGVYSSLDHYFRQMFHIIRYVNENTDISYSEKYWYIKTLRTNLSDYEQAVLFLCSMSCIGRKWERVPEINGKLSSFKKQDFQLITKYNLIKNIPDGLLGDIKPEKYYPLVTFEYSNEKKSRPEYK